MNVSTVVCKVTVYPILGAVLFSCNLSSCLVSSQSAVQSLAALGVSVTYPAESPGPIRVDKHGRGPPLAAPVRRIFYLSAEGTMREHEVFPPPNPRLLTQVDTADALVYGMGSLYTSICPSLVLKVGLADFFPQTTSVMLSCKALSVSSCSHQSKSESQKGPVEDFCQKQTPQTLSAGTSIAKAAWPSINESCHAGCWREDCGAGHTQDLLAERQP